MIAVIFEVTPTASGKQEYLQIASELREHLSGIEGFISIERFQSLADDEKILSISFWENEDAIAQWRNLELHRAAQHKGKTDLFKDYRIRVATVVRDYSKEERSQVPEDSKLTHDEVSSEE